MTRLIDVRFVIFLLAVNNVYAERIKDMIYMSVDNVAACFRKQNGTHQFGCSSDRSGSVGVIHFVDDPSDLKWLEDNGKAGPYTTVMPLSMFTTETIKRLEATNNINGILLTKNASAPLPSSYTPEDTCPNRYSGFKSCDNENPWNPLGSSFLMKDWPFPIFFMQNATLLEEIRECYLKHNAHDTDQQVERSLCALEMNSFMHSAVNSETCLRRSSVWNFQPTVFCDPLGDRNIHWPVGPLTDSTESVILVTARLDSNSMFDGLVPGGNSAITGLVTLLATANYLNSLNATVEKTNVVFSIFNGEALDYIGSSRVAYDLKQGTFNSIGGENLGIDKIAAIIELGQLGGVDELFLHANNHNGNILIENLQKELSLENSTLENSVPPSSIQSFLSVKPNLTAVVISNHGKQFTNKYYHGILDNAQSLGLDGDNDEHDLAASLVAIAVKLGNVLYRNITGMEPPQNQENSLLADNTKDLVSQMLSCYLVSANCTLFRAASSPGSFLTDQTYSHYVGVNSHWNKATSLTGQLLVLLTGQQLPNYTSTDCNNERFSWMAGYNFTGLCINSTTNYSIALSPAFTIDGYDMKSGQYSTWTESVWTGLSVRMFLKPSAATERLTIILGSVVGILSFLVVWFVNSRADLLFDNRRADDC